MAARHRSSSAGSADACLERLAACELIVVAGKGGSGRSTVAALTATRLARADRPVLLLDTDPRESLYGLLGVAPSGGEPVSAGPGLTLQLADPERIVGELVGRHVPFGIVARRIVASSAFRQIVSGAPGLSELALLAHAFGILTDPPPGPVVLDAPATGHALALLDAPTLVRETIAEGRVRDAAGEIADRLGDPAATAIVVTTTAEELPVDETLELLRGIRERGLADPRLLVVNALYPALDDAEIAEDSAAGTFLAARRAVNEQHRSRLLEAWEGPHVELPLLPDEPGPGLLAALGASFSGGGR